MGAWLVIVMYATPIWLVVMLLVGLPFAAWVERRTPAGASAVRRHAPYVVVAAVLAVLLFLYVPLIAPVVVVCVMTGRAGVGARRYRRRDPAPDTPTLTEMRTPIPNGETSE